MNIWIITASREWTDKELFCSILDANCPYINLLVHGGARGGDTLADGWARRRGIHVAKIDALWTRYGKPAGGKRNKIMCDAFPSAHVLGLPLENSIGTWDCIKYAKSKDMRTTVIPNAQIFTRV